MKTKITVTDLQITDDYFTIEYVATELGVINRVRVPPDSPMDHDSVLGYIAKDMERIKDKIEKLQELKKAYAGQGFVIELK